MTATQWMPLWSGCMCVCVCSLKVFVCFVWPHLKAKVFMAVLNGHTRRWGEKPGRHREEWDAILVQMGMTAHILSSEIFMVGNMISLCCTEVTGRRLEWVAGQTKHRTLTPDTRGCASCILCVVRFKLLKHLSNVSERETGLKWNNDFHLHIFFHRPRPTNIIQNRRTEDYIAGSCISL